MPFRPKALDGVALAFALFLLALVIFRPSVVQWDYYNMHEAAKAYQAGLNPYQAENLIKVTERESFSGVRYSYLPMVLVGFQWIALFSGKIGFYVWLLLKILAWVGLFYLWSHYFLRLKPNGHTILYFIFALNSALYIDLVTGNVSVFEELGIWLALLCLLFEQVWPFCILIALVAQLKLMPIFFLALPLVIYKKPRILEVFTGLCIFFGLIGLNLIFWPELFQNFLDINSHLQNFPRAQAQGSLEFIAGVLQAFNKRGFEIPPYFLYIVYALVFVNVSFRSVFLIRKDQKFFKSSHLKPVLLFFCVTYVVIAPRTKDYSYVLLLVPALYLLQRLPKKYWIPFPLIFLLLPDPNGVMPIRDFFKVLYHYMPYVSACVLWVFYYLTLKKDAQVFLENKTEK